MTISDKSIIGRSTAAMAVALAVPATLLATATGAVASQTVSLSYRIASLPKGASLTVLYTGGVSGNAGGFAQAHAGALGFVHFLSGHSLEVSAASSSAFTGEVSEEVIASGSTISGQASIPSGAAVQLYAMNAEKTIDLPNGPFSISLKSGLGAELSKPAGEKVDCVGDASSCEARVSIAGPASSRTVAIKLADRDMTLSSAKPDSSPPEPAFNLTDGHYSQDGSGYLVTVNSLNEDPADAYVKLTFERASSAG